MVYKWKYIVCRCFRYFSGHGLQFSSAVSVIMQHVCTRLGVMRTWTYIQVFSVESILPESYTVCSLHFRMKSVDSPESCIKVCTYNFWISLFSDIFGVLNFGIVCHSFTIGLIVVNYFSFRHSVITRCALNRACPLLLHSSAYAIYNTIIRNVIKIVWICTA